MAFKYDRSIFSLGNLIFVVIFLCVAGAAFFFLWFNHHQKMAPIVEPVTEAPKLAVVSVTSKNLLREDQLPGEINAYQDVLIYPKVPGFIKWIGVDRGSVVKKDQLMVRMYAPEYLADRNKALAQVAAAKASVSVEESQLEDLKAALKKSKANLLADQSTYQRVYTV